MSDIIIDTKEVDRVAAALGKNRDAIIRIMGFDIESEAKQNAPVDTSALENSHYTETHEGNTFQAASSAAKGMNPKVNTIQHPKPDEGFVNVGPCVDYAMPVEFGTSKMAAQPYLVPAAESVSQKFNSGERWKGLTGHESN